MICKHLSPGIPLRDRSHASTTSGLACAILPDNHSAAKNRDLNQHGLKFMNATSQKPPACVELLAVMLVCNSVNQC